MRLVTHVDRHADEGQEGDEPELGAALHDIIIADWQVGTTKIDRRARATELRGWLDSVTSRSSTRTMQPRMQRHTRLLEIHTDTREQRAAALEKLRESTAGVRLLQQLFSRSSQSPPAPLRRTR